MFRTDKNWTAHNTTKRYQPQTLQYKIVVRRTSSLCANLIIKSKYYLTIIGFCCCYSFYIEFSGCHVVINRWISQLTTSHQHLKWPQQFNQNKKRFQIFFSDKRHQKLCYPKKLLIHWTNQCWPNNKNTKNHPREFVPITEFHRAEYFSVIGIISGVFIMIGVSVMMREHHGVWLFGNVHSSKWYDI